MDKPFNHLIICLTFVMPVAALSGCSGPNDSPEQDVLPDVRSSVQHPIHGAAGDSSHLGYGLYRRFGTHEITSFVCDVLLHNLS